MKKLMLLLAAMFIFTNVNFVQAGFGGNDTEIEIEVEIDDSFNKSVRDSFNKSVRDSYNVDKSIDVNIKDSFNKSVRDSHNVDKSVNIKDNIVIKDSLRNNTTQIGRGNTSVEGDINSHNTINTKVNIPTEAAPAMVVRYMSPPKAGKESITASRFAVEVKVDTTLAKLFKKASPDMHLWITPFPNWGQNFDLEFEIENALKATKNKTSVKMIKLGDNQKTIEIPANAIYVGECHGWTNDYKKDESQLVAAAAYQLGKKGANTFFYYSFNDNVNMGDSAVLGGGGVSASPTSSGMGTGGFGITKAFVNKRAQGRVRGYYIPPAEKK